MKTEPRFHNAPHFKNFWEKGNGRDLLDWADFKPDINNFGKFSFLYHQIDELGDKAVRATYLKLPYPQASALIKKYSAKKITESDDAPESVKKLFLQMQEVPAWFDENLANTGARLCMRSGTNALIILRDFVLMGGYDYAYLKKPLIFTGA